jgi:hypothetical protein
MDGVQRLIQKLLPHHLWNMAANHPDTSSLSVFNRWFKTAYGALLGGDRQYFQLQIETIRTISRSYAQQLKVASGVSVCSDPRMSLFEFLCCGVLSGAMETRVIEEIRAQLVVLIAVTIIEGVLDEDFVDEIVKTELNDYLFSEVDKIHSPALKSDPVPQNPYPPFTRPEGDPVVIFPGVKSNGENYLALLDRGSVLTKIREDYLKYFQSGSGLKYPASVIACASGMGKTFLLKKFALQDFPKEYRWDFVATARRYNRIIYFEMKTGLVGNGSITARNFLTKLLIFYLSNIFDGYNLNGINFAKLESIDSVDALPVNVNPDLRRWVETRRAYREADMIKEFLDLTFKAYREADSDVDPKCTVLLLDEIQLFSDNFLPDILCLMDQLRAVGIVVVTAGTDDRNITSITPSSRISPEIQVLRPFTHADSLIYWEASLKHAMKSTTSEIEKKFETNPEINFIITSTYSIPRLLAVAFGIWFEYQSQRKYNNLQSFTVKLVEAIAGYLSSFTSRLMEYGVVGVFNIILATTVRWDVIESVVPGTDVKWNDLKIRSLVFPGDDASFIIPLDLVFMKFSEEFRIGLYSHAQSVMKGFNLDSFILNSTQFLSCDVSLNGFWFEIFIAHTLAARWCLYRWRTGEPLVPLDRILGIRDSRVDSMFVDLSGGVERLAYRANVKSRGLKRSVIYVNGHGSHHDLLLPILTQKGELQFYLAFQSKFSMERPKRDSVDSQVKVSKDSTVLVRLLVWINLSPGEVREDARVIFLNGLTLWSSPVRDHVISMNRLHLKNRSEPGGILSPEKGTVERRSKRVRKW